MIDLFVMNECRSQRDENEDFGGESIEPHSSFIYT